MSVLRAIGVAAPAARLEQDRIALLASRITGADARGERALQRLYSASGVERRHIGVSDPGGGLAFYAGEGTSASGAGGGLVGPTTAERVRRYASIAPGLAREACAACVSRAGISAGEVTHLVTVSCTGMSSPGVDQEIIESLVLRADVQRTNIGFMGCHAAINGLRIADALAGRGGGSDGRGTCVLVCCVELCSLHFHYAPGPGAATANALFGDGAAACIVTPGGSGWRLASFGSRLFPATSGDMTWRIGDHGFEMGLSASVPDALRVAVGPWVREWLGGTGRSIGDVGRWVIHPGGPRIVQSVIESLGLAGARAEAASELALGMLRERGNMSSPTVLFMLAELERCGSLAGTVGCLAFGPGLAGEAVLLEAAPA